MMAGRDVWSSFSHDPRHPEHAGLRATDGDRGVLHDLLTDAYADGRLDRDEFDLRSGQVEGARILGELPSLVRDLVPTSAVPVTLPAGSVQAADDLDARALEKWQSSRREAWRNFLGLSVLVWTLWAVTSGTDSFPWPLFVSLVTGLKLLRVATSRVEMVAENRRRLEKKERRALEASSGASAEGGPDDVDTAETDRDNDDASPDDEPDRPAHGD